MVLPMEKQANEGLVIKYRGGGWAGKKGGVGHCFHACKKGWASKNHASLKGWGT